MPTFPTPSNNNPSFFNSKTSLNSAHGLSKLHRSILSRTQQRQRFVTGRDPLYVTITENPTRKWLGAAETEILVNGTRKSVASFDRFDWLDEQARRDAFSLELIAEIHLERPGYLQILTRKSSLSLSSEADPYECLWATGFSLAGRKGLLKSVDCASGNMASINARTARRLLWPNEVGQVPRELVTTNCRKSQPVAAAADEPCWNYLDSLLVCDGFLVPGKDRGGLHVVKHPGDDQKEWIITLTPSNGQNDRWFYHRATWLDLTRDGRQSILTARCQVSTNLASNAGVTSGITKRGELVWLECPKPACFDAETGTPLESDGTTFDPLSSRHLPWKVHVLAQGPDVMFSVADLNPADDTVEILASHFFAKQVVLHSIQMGPRPKVVFEKVIDDRCGAAFGCILADLDCLNHNLSTAGSHRVVDSGSTVKTVNRGDPFSHLLVTSHECSFTNSEARADGKADKRLTSDEGGSLYAYRVPHGKNSWKTEPWTRSTIATGFKVNGQLNNMVNPGAPGFVYTFDSEKQFKGRKSKRVRPMIAVAGDCAESAYVFRPQSPSPIFDKKSADPSTDYSLMVEFKCGATVGSIGIGYDEFTSTEQESGYAKLYVPCYEKDKVIVFALGSGDGDDDGW
jgi:hypothetical protein